MQGCPTTLLNQPTTEVVFLYSWTKVKVKFAGEETIFSNYNPHTLWDLLAGKRSEF